MMSIFNRNKKAPKLSIVVICYNMQREIIRTIQSLLPPYQQDISYEDIEIIVVDNTISDDWPVFLNECSNVKVAVPRHIRQLQVVE